MTDIAPPCQRRSIAWLWVLTATFLAFSGLARGASDDLAFERQQRLRTYFENNEKFRGLTGNVAGLLDKRGLNNFFRRYGDALLGVQVANDIANAKDLEAGAKLLKKVQMTVIDKLGLTPRLFKAFGWFEWAKTGLEVLKHFVFDPAVLGVALNNYFVARDAGQIPEAAIVVRAYTYLREQALGQFHAEYGPKVFVAGKEGRELLPRWRKRFDRYLLSWVEMRYQAHVFERVQRAVAAARTGALAELEAFDDRVLVLAWDDRARSEAAAEQPPAIENAQEPERDEPTSALPPSPPTTDVAVDEAGVQRIRAALANCEVTRSETLLGELPTGAVRSELEEERRLLEARERAFRDAYQAAQQLGREGRRQEALERMRAARRETRCERYRHRADRIIAELERELSAREAVARAQRAIRECRFKAATTASAEISDDAARESALAELAGALERERGTGALIREGNALYESGRLGKALEAMESARGNTACERYRTHIDEQIAAIRAAHDRNRIEPTEMARAVCGDSLPGSTPYMLEGNRFECRCRDPMVPNDAGDACRASREVQLAALSCTGGRAPVWNPRQERAGCDCDAPEQRWNGTRCVGTSPAHALGSGAPTGEDAIGALIGRLFAQAPGPAPRVPGGFGPILGVRGDLAGSSRPVASAQCRRIVEDFGAMMNEMRAGGRPTSSAEDERVGRIYIGRMLGHCDRAERARCDFGNPGANDKFYGMCRNLRQGRLY